eukprot:5506558-Pleurochrysis_carterae.AAC.2
MSAFQWRSRIASSRRSWMSGSDTVMLFTASVRPAKTFHFCAGRGSAFTSFCSFLVSSIILSTSTCVHSVAR